MTPVVGRVSNPSCDEGRVGNPSYFGANQEREYSVTPSGRQPQPGRPRRSSLERLQALTTLGIGCQTKAIKAIKAIMILACRGVIGLLAPRYPPAIPHTSPTRDPWSRWH